MNGEGVVELIDDDDDEFVNHQSINSNVELFLCLSRNRIVRDVVVRLDRVGLGEKG